MTKYYNAKRTRNIFEINSKVPFKLSRSKIDLFLNCPRCFYLDRRLGIGQPPGFPMSLNVAVDKLLKKEFDIHRSNGSVHPLMKTYGVDAIPFQHEKIDTWRDSLGGGIQYLHIPTNLLITGGVDDVWVNPDRELIIVDYKATAKDGEVSLDAEWQIGYKRQMEIYQWLFRKNNFKVSNTGFFVYCNGDTDKKAFDGKLEFTVKILPYDGNDDWVEGTVLKAHECLISNELPQVGENCDFCAYRTATKEVEK
ncbi:PD-(D/E)XK nuclease family protein [Candidatus Jorgensenbacteria bacterium]|nr:PD-(D/E)XK nuclease family protein [Candidatus Jorgensenbacteria bacterium]